MEFHLAQLNIGVAKGPMDGPVMAGFAAELDRINELADGAPRFVWRLQTEDGDATAIRPYEDERMMVNMSVWESIEELRRFVYKSGHTDVMRRRKEWFEALDVYLVLWWVPAGPRADDRGGQGTSRAPGAERPDPSRVHVQGELRAPRRRDRDRRR